MGSNEQICGSFANPTCDLISYLAPQRHHNDNAKGRDYPWRRRAYDRTLSCPDLARAINDFLFSDADFEEELPVRLCA